MADKTNRELMQAALALRAEGLLSFQQTVEIALKLAGGSDSSALWVKECYATVKNMVDSFYEVQYLAEQQLIDDITRDLDKLF